MYLVFNKQLVHTIQNWCMDNNFPEPFPSPLPKEATMLGIMIFIFENKSQLNKHQSMKEREEHKYKIKIQNWDNAQKWKGGKKQSFKFEPQT